MIREKWLAKLREWKERWRNWVGDREIERAIHAELLSQGYRPSASRILDFRLVAIERPGWVCVYQFGVEAIRQEGQTAKLAGVVRDDSRVRSIVKIFADLEQRNQQRDAWSEGLILSPQLRREQA